MDIDIIKINAEDLEKLTVEQMSILRAAQKSKNELRRKTDEQIAEFKRRLLNNDTYHSSLLASKRAELEEEYEYRLNILIDQLEFDLSLEGSVPDHGNGSEQAGYLVDYSLSYTDRYAIVRDYYLKISDREERLARYAADEVAKKYLNSYYNALFDVLSTYG